MMGVFARVVVHNFQGFVAFFQAGPGGPSALEAFVAAWMEAFDCIPTLPERKLSSMAFCLLLRIPQPWVLQQLTSLVGCITSSLLEVCC